MERREFLKRFFAVAGAAGAAVVLAKVGVPAAEAAPVTASGPQPRPSQPQQPQEPAGKTAPAESERAGDEMSSQYYYRRRRVYYYRRPRRVYYRRRYRRWY
jgi:hypothetical protein